MPHGPPRGKRTAAFNDLKTKLQLRARVRWIGPPRPQRQSRGQPQRPCVRGDPRRKDAALGAAPILQRRKSLRAPKRVHGEPALVDFEHVLNDCVGGDLNSVAHA
jgi:hypothetical protein